MGLIPFQPARKAGNGFEVQQMDPTSALTIYYGAPVQRNSGTPSQIEEAAGTSTVTGILGVTMGGSTSGAPGYGTTLPIARASTTVEFIGQVYDVSGAVVQTAAVATHEGKEFGMIKSGNYWYVDEEDTTDVVLRVTKVLTDINAVLFKFIDTAIED